MNTHKRIILALALAMATPLILASAGPAGAASKHMKEDLAEGWSIINAREVAQGGEEISTPGFDRSGWIPARVPATVMAALVEAGEIEDPYFGVNLKSVPGALPPPLDISASRMPPFSPFRDPWWYAIEFDIPPGFSGQRIWLELKGVNYRANVWMNGRKIAGSDRIVGAYRYFELDVTEAVRAGRTNALALEVFAPERRELAFSWVDWNPAPPDRDMGIWREASLIAAGPVRIRRPRVRSEIDLATLGEARLTVAVEVENGSESERKATVRGRTDSISFAKEVTLGPGEKREVLFSPEEFPVLVIREPRLWWPYQMGEPNLYDLEISAEVGGEISDSALSRFGVRDVKSEFTEEGNLVFKVNGKRVLIRGAGWAPDMMLRPNPERLAWEIRYVKEMNLNAIRLEGKLETDEFYDLCDQEGIMVIAGWCCCHHWERWHAWDKEDHVVAERSQRDQIRRLGSHPCMIAWMNASDMPPPPAVEKVYLETLEEAGWPNPSISSASEKPAKFSGPSGVKMTGPYDYVPPLYWYEDDKRGGAWGFNTETSPGPAVPPIESLEAMLPADELWPVNDYWNYHAGRNLFGNISIFKKAQDSRYGPSSGAEEFSVKSQAMCYEGERAMFEAYGREKYTATGVIQWMLNDAWPSIIWHLYDYYLRPGGGYFGTKKALEPLHVQYSYDDRSIVVVNGRVRPAEGLTLKARLFNLDMEEKWCEEFAVSVDEDAVKLVGFAPEPEGLTSTYFLKLELRGEGGESISDNFYWLSTKPDVLSWMGSTWYYTPAKSHADFKALNDLETIGIEARADFKNTESWGSAEVAVRNPSGSLAFMVRLKMVAGGEEILPVFWEDNYFSLLPGEERTIKVEFPLPAAKDNDPILEVGGWNVSGYEPLK